jgi:predicted short-subunit dehydrogenase-like oxidoreductase (DUF2520 family)
VAPYFWWFKIKKKMSHRFVFIGAGNLATHLSKRLKQQGFNILQVYSRTKKSAKELAEKIDAEFTSYPERISKEADVYIVAIKDSVYEEVLSQIDFGEKLLVHCSGSMPMSVLENFAENFGVIYPLQTFSKHREVNFAEIPVFVEANSEENERRLIEISEKISDTVSVMNSEKRLFLHIAAVFSCNFVNHFYTRASEVLAEKNIPFDVLKPLIMETAQKVQEMNPATAQTGPAVRFDENVINKHLEALEFDSTNRELYNSISKSIFEFHQKKQ